MEKPGLYRAFFMFQNFTFSAKNFFNHQLIKRLHLVKNQVLVKVYGSSVFGVEATTITVEVNVASGIGYHLVGLPDNAVKESSYRITAALQNNQYKLPGKKRSLSTWRRPIFGKRVLLMISLLRWEF